MISWERVHELRDEVGEDDFAEVVELFLEEVDAVMARLRGARDLASYEADLHFLKGSAMNLGFRALGALCHDRERRMAADPGSAPDLVDLFATYEASRAEFLASDLRARTH
jgi:HPt (histidine-containing phosphotransfer) domain-containing protein